jgi:AcrR family transcriptional regulator
MSMRGSRSRARRPRRAGDTRRALLDAAREVFAAQGYAAASVADVVQRADASVGSLYHHFGGKVDLFLALWEDHRVGLEEAAAEAVAARREAGESDPAALFVAGAGAYLEACWQRRDVAALFLNGDGPPGFDLLRRQNTREWLRQNAALLQVEERPAQRALVAVLTTAMGEVGREVVKCGDEAERDELVGAALALIERICDVQT